MVWNKTNGVEHVKWYGKRQMVWNKTNCMEQDKWCGTRQMVWNKTNGVEIGMRQMVWNKSKCVEQITIKPGTKRKMVWNNILCKKIGTIQGLEQIKRIGTIYLSHLKRQYIEQKTGVQHDKV